MTPQVAVETHVIDVADRPALLDLAARIAADHPDLDLLVNNAGVALGGNFEHTTLEEFDWVMDINFRAPVASSTASSPRSWPTPEATS